MTTAKTALGRIGSKFFALVQSRRREIVRLGELRSPLGITAPQEQTLLKRLSKNGYLLRLQRGVYLVPSKLPAGGYWQPNEYYIVAKYMEVFEANYYISGPNAFHHHHFTTQIANQVTVYNDKISRTQKMGKLQIHCIKIASQRIDGFEKLILPNNKVVLLASCARAILDAINDCHRYQTLPEAYEWLLKKIQDEKFLREFIRLTAHCATKSTIRRVGYFLAEQGISNYKLKKLQERLAPTKSWVTLIPSKSRVGKVNFQWGIINNAK